MSTVEQAGAGFDIRRLALVVALALTIAVIAAGTWVLGSGADPVEQDRAAVITELRAPDRAQPPLSVAPLSVPAPGGSSG